MAGIKTRKWVMCLIFDFFLRKNLRKGLQFSFIYAYLKESLF